MELAKTNPGGEMQELETLLNSIQTACKAIGGLIRTASITGLTGYHAGGGSVNVQGEEQKKLDVITNDILKNCLKFTGKLNVLASEEEDSPVPHSDIVVDEGNKFVAVFDPLDGSSNVDASIPTGTIFGIFRSDDAKECQIDPDLSAKAQMEKCLVQTLQPGTNLVAAGYCLYSSSTHFVFTYGDGVNGFTFDPVMGEFILTHPNIRIPPRGKIYSFNEANRWDWDVPLQEYVTAIQNGEGESGAKYSSRYIGSMVGDVHRTLLYGGIFGYPADKKNQDGKLRLLYEAAPMAFIVEQAGGLALTGKNPIMLIHPKQVHTRVPCILGSQLDVMECQKYYAESTDPELIARCLKRMKDGSAI
jgi:fructose-1,6-bisphosphatase I